MPYRVSLLTTTNFTTDIIIKQLEQLVGINGEDWRITNYNEFTHSCYTGACHVNLIDKVSLAKALLMFDDSDMDHWSYGGFSTQYIVITDFQFVGDYAVGRPKWFEEPEMIEIAAKNGFDLIKDWRCG